MHRKLDFRPFSLAIIKFVRTYKKLILWCSIGGKLKIENKTEREAGRRSRRSVKNVNVRGTIET